MKLTLILSAILVGWLSQNPAFAAETPDKKSHSHADHAPQTSHQEGEEVHDDEAHHENETDHTHTDEEHRNDENNTSCSVLRSREVGNILSKISNVRGTMKYSVMFIIQR